MDYETKNCYMKGEVNLFVISKDIYSIGGGGRIVDMPYLMAEFYKNSVKIYELHCDIKGYSYENKGYGTMMIETLKAIARQSNCRSIYGKLSWVDADTEEEKTNEMDFTSVEDLKLSIMMINRRQAVFICHYNIKVMYWDLCKGGLHYV